MWHVLWNGKPAILEENENIWKNNAFSTFKEAKEYALNWLGIYGLGIEIVPNQKIEIGYFGWYIEVNEVQ